MTENNYQALQDSLKEECEILIEVRHSLKSAMFTSRNFIRTSQIFRINI